MTAPVLGVPLLIDYLYWLRDRVLAAADGLQGDAFRRTPVANTRDLRATLVHELDVEIGWRARLRGDPPEAWGDESTLQPEAFPTLEELARRWRVDESEMRGWIAGLEPDELASPTTVNRLEGYPLSVYVLHLVQHGVQELTSAAVILTQLGRSPGDLGVLDALDELAPIPRPATQPAPPAAPPDATKDPA